MKKIIFKSAVALTIVLTMASCFTQQHIVGQGGSGAPVEKRQWFALFGLVPLNTVDSKAMAGGKQNYTITTQETFLDGVISLFTSFVTVAPRTVIVNPGSN